MFFLLIMHAYLGLQALSDYNMIDVRHVESISLL